MNNLSLLKSDYRVLGLLTLCLIYALCGSPTPDQFGFVELVIGGLLVISIGLICFFETLSTINKDRFWIGAGQLFLGYGLVVSTLNGALQGQDFSSMIRDIVPFLYLFLPLFFLPAMRQSPSFFLFLTVGIVVIGICFSVRSLYHHEALLYLENMPTVLLACLLLLGGGIQLLCSKENGYYKMTALCLILVSALPILAMVMTLQRASIGAVFLYVLMILTYLFWTRPQSAVLPIFVIAAFMLGLFTAYGHLAEGFFDKTDKVGLNMRPQEFWAVWQILKLDPYHFLFGTGWGGTFHSPAVANLRVNFTHNFFSSILLKTGVCGLILASTYIAGLLERLIRIILANPVIGLAISAPVLIDLLLYASFKSLDFGLVLLIIPAFLIYSRHSESS